MNWCEKNEIRGAWIFIIEEKKKQKKKRKMESQHSWYCHICDRFWSNCHLTARPFFFFFNFYGPAGSKSDGSIWVEPNRLMDFDWLRSNLDSNCD